MRGRVDGSSVGGQSASVFLFPSILSLTNLWAQAQVFQFVLCSPKDLFSGVYPPMQEKKERGGKETREKAPLSWSLLAVRDKSFPFLTLPT